MKWLYTFAVVTPAWYEAAEGSLCRPRSGLLTARARCFEDHIRNLLDAEGASSLAFLRVIMGSARLHSRVANPQLGWLAQAGPAQHAAWERFEREDLLIQPAAQAALLPVPTPLPAWLARPAAAGRPDSDGTAADAFNRAVHDSLNVLAESRHVLVVTGRSIGARGTGLD